MNMLIDDATFGGLRSRDLVPFACVACGATFHRRKHHVQAALKRGGGAGGHTMESCSPDCGRALVSARASRIVCTECGVHVRRPPSEIAKVRRPFCSRRCSMIYRNRGKDLGKTKRSRGEEYLAELIASEFPGISVQRNVRDVLPSGLEIDLLLPDLGIAIEVNGPVHVLPIYGEDKLSAVQAIDRRKRVEIDAAGLRLVEIDISHCRSGKKTSAALDHLYASHIRPLLLPS